MTNESGHPTEKLDDSDTERWNMDVSAVFFAIGHIPNTDYLKNTGVEVDETGYIKVSGGRTELTKTDVEGIFAAGDVVDHHYQQAATASGMGVKAALDVDEYLN